MPAPRGPDGLYPPGFEAAVVGSTSIHFHHDSNFFLPVCPVCHHQLLDRPISGVSSHSPIVLVEMRGSKEQGLIDNTGGPRRRTSMDGGAVHLRWKVWVMRNTDRYPIATSYLVEAFKKLTGRTDFTALLLTEHVEMKCHRDVHNHGQRNNLLCQNPSR